MFKLVDCYGCRASLPVPPGARSIRCGICLSVIRTAEIHSAPPDPYNHAPSCPLPSLYGRKRAVICAVSYKSTPYELHGCINDAKYMKNLLMNRFRFPESSILMLSEEEADFCRIPTKQNMRMALYWLVQGCQAGDSLVFHFSGHGSQQRNYYGDEVDGFDETLCPSDFETEGMIVDDEINATIVRPLPYGAKLHATVDACHSGTVLDLPFLCRMDSSGRYVWEDHRPQSGVWKGTSGGTVFCFSGCDDDQAVAETMASSNSTSAGSMTCSFIQAIEQGHGATYGSMLTAMKSIIRSQDTALDGGIVSSLVTMLRTRGRPFRLRQKPQLTASEPFDVYQKPFSL